MQTKIIFKLKKMANYKASADISITPVSRAIKSSKLGTDSISQQVEKAILHTSLTVQTHMRKLEKIKLMVQEKVYQIRNRIKMKILIVICQWARK